MALQTREQHIKEIEQPQTSAPPSITSNNGWNVCCLHGPKGLKHIAKKIHEKS